LKYGVLFGSAGASPSQDHAKVIAGFEIDVEALFDEGKSLQALRDLMA
jgi:hypothetical protein